MKYLTNTALWGTGAAHTYQQTVLKALEEAESALASYTQDKSTMKEYTLAKESKLTVLSQARHAKGLIDLLNLLDSKKNLNEAELTLLQSESTTLLDLIALYKALGGGWQNP